MKHKSEKARSAAQFLADKGTCLIVKMTKSMNNHNLQTLRMQMKKANVQLLFFKRKVMNAYLGADLVPKSEASLLVSGDVEQLIRAAPNNFKLVGGICGKESINLEQAKIAASLGLKNSQQLVLALAGMLAKTTLTQTLATIAYPLYIPGRLLNAKAKTT